MTGKKSYLELLEIPEFLDRFLYLRLSGSVGELTFGGRRYLNQILYQSTEWKDCKRRIILRDNGNDLSHPDWPIYGKAIYVHHINPITVDDILERRPCVFDPNNLICCSFDTHQAIHYGTKAERIKAKELIERKPNDTCPWRN